MASSDPIEEFHNILAAHDFVFAVYYRGHWCPFCQAYIRTLESLTPQIKALGGIPLIITAEVAQHLPATLEATGYTGASIVDPTNALAKALKGKGVIDIAISPKAGYEHGMAQPGILVIKKDRTVLESWAIVPGMMNMGGATDRPDLNQVLENVQLKLKGGQAKHTSYATMGMLSLMKSKMCG